MKERIRSQMRAIRRTLTLSESDQAQLIQNLQAILTAVKITPKTIALYKKMGGEIEPSGLVTYLEEQGYTCVFPEIQDNATMTFNAAPDIIITPLVAFDRQGHRLGQGGGYYDRYLEHSKALHIGLAYAEQEVKNIPAELHDQKLHWIITPKEFIKT